MLCAALLFAPGVGKRTRQKQAHAALHWASRVRADGGRLPAAVVAARVALVQLEAVHRVPASEEEGDAKGAQAAKLCVPLSMRARTREPTGA